MITLLGKDVPNWYASHFGMRPCLVNAPFLSYRSFTKQAPYVRDVLTDAYTFFQVQRQREQATGWVIL